MHELHVYLNSFYYSFHFIIVFINGYVQMDIMYLLELDYYESYVCVRIDPFDIFKSSWIVSLLSYQRKLPIYIERMLWCAFIIYLEGASAPQLANM